MTTPVLAFQNVTKSFPRENREDRTVLRDLTFELPAGGTVAMVGRSGSGKSTLLHLAAGIDIPTRGAVRLDGRDLGSLSEHQRTLVRRETVGLVFQFFHLLPHLNVRDNIALPEWIEGGNHPGLEERVRQLLRQVGLEDRGGDPVQKLSGGEMQRVALCRALLRKPRLLLADEPTGNLDDASGRNVMNLLLDLAREEGSTLLYVTHSRELAGLADRVWELQSGILSEP